MNEKELIWNPLRAGYLENPHTQLSLLRERNPVHQGINGSWLLFKYDDVKLFLTSPVFKTIKLNKRFISKNQFLTQPDSLDQLATAVSKWLFFLDPPEHTEVRNLVVKVWNKYNVQEFIEQVVAEAIGYLKTTATVEILEHYAAFIPIKIICRILGLPFEDFQRLRVWAQHFAHTLEPFESFYSLLNYNQSADEFYKYVETIMEEKRIKPDKSFISDFQIENRMLEKPLDHNELISIFIILFFAGIETSIYLFGQSLFHLIRNPLQQQLLRNNSALTQSAVEELIRYASPLQYTPRITAGEIEINGQRIPAGAVVLGCIASANRDPRIFDNPEDLNIARKPNPHLGFGAGFHHCIGAKLARDEMNVAIPAFVKNFSKIEIDPQNSYEWDKIIINRGLKSLHLNLAQ